MEKRPQVQDILDNELYMELTPEELKELKELKGGGGTSNKSFATLATSKNSATLATSKNSATLAIPADLAYNLTGCPGCTSGYDTRFIVEQDFILNANYSI